MKWLDDKTLELTHACLFAGAGGLSLGLQRGHAREGRVSTRMRCLGGIDAWPLACESFGMITGSRGIQMDLFARADYVAFHGREPPAGWREVTPADMLAAFGEPPDILASSPPCKGLSGLLNAASAASAKYQALNRLVVRGLALALEAFKNEPPALIVLENVPRIQTRGKDLLDELKALLRAYGYAVNGYPHNCGELGGLGQNRDRYLLVARYTKKVKPFLYVPPLQRVRSIGDVIGHLPLPEHPALGVMHRLPRLTWRTWVRLALIPAGKDWRALHELQVCDGYLRDIGIMPIEAGWHADALGVRSMDATAGTVKGRSMPTNGPFSVADPRLDCDAGDSHGRRHNNVYRLFRWDETCGTVTAGSGPAAGGQSVADPRITSMGQHSGKMHVQVYAGPARTVTGTDSRVGSGAQCVADPRPGDASRYGSNTHMQAWPDASRTVIGATDIQTGAGLVADPRVMTSKSRDGDWAGGGQYGVAPWVEPCNTVAAKAKHDTGFWSVADPRLLPAADDRPDPVPVIVSLDSTWHRPLTTLELAVLQGYPLHLWDGSPLRFAGKADAHWREQIGNSVPPPAAEAMACEMARTLLMAAIGTTFELRAAPVWVQPFVAALSAPSHEEVAA